MRLIDLDKFLRENCIDRMEGKSCEECKYHVLEVSCERLMEQPTIDPVKRGLWIEHKGGDDYIGYPIYECSECGYDAGETATNYCPNCGALMREDGEENGS